MRDQCRHDFPSRAVLLFSADSRYDTMAEETVQNCTELKVHSILACRMIPRFILQQFAITLPLTHLFKRSRITPSLSVIRISKCQSTKITTNNCAINRIRNNTALDSCGHAPLKINVVNFYSLSPLFRTSSLVKLKFTVCNRLDFRPCIVSCPSL